MMNIHIVKTKVSRYTDETLETIILDARVRNIISQSPKYRFFSNIDFPRYSREIAASLNDFSNRWYKRENVEPDALKEWKINIFKIIDTPISFYSRNTHLLAPKPKSSFRHLKRGNREFIRIMFWFQQIKLLTML